MTSAPTDHSGGRSSARRLAPWVVAMTLLLPVALAIIVFPTPMSDLREQIAWGREFPLVTPRHPPMMVWLSGIVDRVFGPILVPQIILGQGLLLVGIFYIYAILGLLIDRINSFIFVFLFSTTFYMFIAPLSWVMNADILQITSWPAIIYHFLQATRSNRWRHWLAFGAWSAAAMLTKYTAFVLFAAMAISILAVPSFRSTLIRPRFYAAVLLGSALVAPHAIALIESPASIVYGTKRLGSETSLVSLAQHFANLVGGYFLVLFPGWLIVAGGLWRRDLALRRPAMAGAERPGELHFVLVLNAAMLALLIVLIAFGGLSYKARFDAPIAALAVLAFAPLFAWVPERRVAGEWRIVRGVGLLNLTIAVCAGVVYLFFTDHSVMQEPFDEPTEIIMADWHSRYSCGPAYVIGHKRAAQLVGIHAGDTTTIATGDIGGASWFDLKALRSGGAIVVDYAPIIDASVREVVPNAILTDERSFAAGLLRTASGRTLTYYYRFLPPNNCRQ